jgi:hypothetical protein
MNLSNIKNISIAVLAGVLLAGGGYFSSDRYEKYQAVQVLKARTLQQMIFVKGGDFMMGDVGYIDENGD